jgi:hypothetical protein
MLLVRRQLQPTGGAWIFRRASMNGRQLRAGVIVLAALAGLMLAACNKKLAGQSLTSDPTVPPTEISRDLQKVAALRIAFGHQSVGNNILEGMGRLVSETGVSLQISSSRMRLTSPGIHHFKIGQNGLPLTKLQDFDAIMRAGVAESADIALMKFCFLDLLGNNDPKALASEYIALLDRLSESFPRTIFVPVTVPLTTVQTGPKAWAKRAVGRNPSGLTDNVQRAEFNAILRRYYSTPGSLFDLAAVESGRGAKHFEYQGKSFEALDPSITHDGAHLNEAGQRRVASALLHHLAALPMP